MKRFQRKRGMLTTQLSGYEVELLTSLIKQLVELVSDGEPEGFTVAEESDDAFERLVRDLKVDPDEPEVSDDPVLKRLFPNAYPHDAAASSDFRRFTERDLKTKKVTEAQTVLDRLSETKLGSVDLRIPRDEADVWLRTLTSVRLAVAARLDITDSESAERLAELPDEDPRSYMVSVYDWLGFAQETLISSL
ncbi:MAG TPA: DUF2017 domain-containing protein [Propionibacteriaceae bacterium]